MGTKIPGVPLSLATIPKSVAIIGAGIAMCFAQKGIKVGMKDIKQEYLNRGMKIIMKNWKRSASKGKWSDYQVKSMAKLIVPTLNYADLSDVDEIASATKRPESVIGMHFFFTRKCYEIIRK